MLDYIKCNQMLDHADNLFLGKEDGLNFEMHNVLPPQLSPDDQHIDGVVVFVWHQPEVGRVDAKRPGGGEDHLVLDAHHLFGKVGDHEDGSMSILWYLKVGRNREEAVVDEGWLDGVLQEGLPVVHTPWDGND